MIFYFVLCFCDLWWVKYKFQMVVDSNRLGNNIIPRWYYVPNPSKQHYLPKLLQT